MNRYPLMCALAVAAACGSVDDTPTDPDGGGSPEPDARASDGPLFYEDVAPIVYGNCVGCHQPGGIAPFSLVDADDSLDDEYRCFVVDPRLATDKFLTALEVLPGDPKVVHHVLLFSLNTPEAEAQAEQLDADAPGPGYQCFGGSGITGLGASNLLGVWAPGTRVSQYPDGTGLPVLGGRKMVMQVHYNLLGGPASDRTRIALQLEDTVALEALIAAVANADLALPPGLASVSSSGTFDIPWWLGDLSVWSVFPHMHTLGRQLRVEIIRDSGTTCTYGTRGRTETVTWGDGTLDEMCLAFFYVTSE